jgi:transcription elongation factor GreA
VAKEVRITEEGFRKLQERLEDLVSNRRREVAERIKEAREFGDISENSEYDDAKNEQAMLESEIIQIEEQLREATVVDATQLDSTIVQVGSMVDVKTKGAASTFQIVGSAEADPDENRISNESPVGKAMLGRKKGEKVDVSVPQGTLKLKVASISAP